VQEGVVAFHHIVAGHVNGNDHARLACQLDCPAHQVLILDQVSLYVEIIVSCKHFWPEVFRNQLQGSPQVYGKGAVRIGSSYKNHGPSRGVDPFEQAGFDAVALLVCIEKRAQLVVSHLPYEARGHAQNGGSRNGVCCRPARHILYPYGFEVLPDPVSGESVYVLHAAVRNVEMLQQGVVGK